MNDNEDIKSIVPELNDVLNEFNIPTDSSSFLISVINQLKEASSFIKEMDDALMNLNYTLNLSKPGLESLGGASIRMAQELKTSASNILDAASIYADRIQTAGSILEKAKASVMLSNVTNMDNESASNILQGSASQFGLEDSAQSLLRVSDVFQKVSQNMNIEFAQGIQEISNGIQVSGSAAKEAGLELENYSAMIGSIIDNTGLGGAAVGQTLRTMMTRTSNASKSALSNGEVSMDEVNKAEAALRKIKVPLRTNAGEFREFDEIMGNLYEKIDKLSQENLSNLAINLAGTNHTSQFEDLIRSFGEYKEMAAKADNAGGTSLSNQEKYANSLTASYSNLDAAAQSLFHTMIGSDALKGFADGGAGVLSVSEHLISQLGLVKTTILGLAAFKSLNGVG